MTTEQARRFVAKSRWIFAKTMPRWPHWYCLRRDALLAGHEDEFLAMVAFIREVGVVRPWPRDARVPRYHHTYLDLDGWSYWTMGAPVEETTLINRARVDSADQFEQTRLEVDR